MKAVIVGVSIHRRHMPAIAQWGDEVPKYQYDPSRSFGMRSRRVERTPGKNVKSYSGIPSQGLKLVPENMLASMESQVGGFAVKGCEEEG